MCDQTHNIVKFHQNPFTGFGAYGWLKFDHSYYFGCLASGFYNGLSTTAEAVMMKIVIPAFQVSLTTCLHC